MSSNSGLDDPNDQLEDDEVASNAPKDSDGGDNGGMDDLFGDGDDDPNETADVEAESTVYGPAQLRVKSLHLGLTYFFQATRPR